MKYRLLAFDFDGTLADSFPFLVEVFDTLADTHGFRRIEGEDRQALRRYDARQLLRHVGLPVWKVPQVSKHFRMLMTANIQRIRLFEGVGAMLQRLVDGGVTLAVVSSNSRDNVQTVLGEHARLIAHYECGASLFGKRQKLRRLLDQSGMQSQETLYVGDELRDLEAARAEQIAFGAVAWGYARFDALLAQSPDVSFEHVEDIAALLG